MFGQYPVGLLTEDIAGTMAVKVNKVFKIDIKYFFTTYNIPEIKIIINGLTSSIG